MEGFDATDWIFLAVALFIAVVAVGYFIRKP